jgi:hypothetical protein
MEGLDEEFIEKVYNDMVRNTVVNKEIDTDDYTIRIQSMRG